MTADVPFTLPYPCPREVDAAIDWSSFDAPWIAELAACPQDPEHHAEGDVWTHTKMVCEALVADAGWRALADDARALVFAGALLHDLAKPVCTRIEDGRIRQPGHSPRGAIMVRNLLWRLGAPPPLREAIVGLVRYHQVPFFAIEEEDPRRRIAALTQSCRADHLALVTRADALGRICRDPQRLLDNIDLFLELCREHGCVDRPFAFPSDHTRFVYFRDRGREPTVLAHDDTRATATLMCGLPGSGKDTWIRDHVDQPVISLDDLREALELPPTGNQGAVIQAAREQAREHLRRGQDFVWNATNLTRDLRRRLIDLFAGYHARIRIVAVESPYRTTLRQNRDREAVVPEKVIERMSGRWELPDRTEAHEVEWVFR